MTAGCISKNFDITNYIYNSKEKQLGKSEFIQLVTIHLVIAITGIKQAILLAKNSSPRTAVLYLIYMFVGVVNISTWQISIVSIIYHMVITYGLIMTMLNTMAINFAKDFLCTELLLTPWTVRIITYRILANRDIVKAFYHAINNGSTHTSAPTR